MAVAANIKINGTALSNTDLPIDTLVTLTNQSTPSASTYLWSIEAQPSGTADIISGGTTSTATFTPTKEGTYLLKLIVDAGLGTEDTDTKIVGVRHLKSLMRVPAAGETTESDASGWAEALESNWGLLDNLIADSGTIICAAGESLAQYDIVMVDSISTIKSGLPGEEIVPACSKAAASSSSAMDMPLGMFVSTVDGNTSASTNDLIVVRLYGLIGPFPFEPTVGDIAYVSDSAALDGAAGTYERRIGACVYASGGESYFFFNGFLPQTQANTQRNPGMREMWWQSAPGLTTIASPVGATAAFTVAVSGATASAVTNNYNGVKYSHGVSSGASNAGVLAASYSADTVRRAHLPRACINFALADGVQSNGRMWLGLTGSDISASDAPSEHYACFRYAPAVDGTAYWRAVSDNGSGTPESTTTIVPVSSGDSHVFEVDMRTDNTILFYCDGILVATHTTKLPGTSTPLNPICISKRDSGSTITSLVFCKFYISTEI